MNVLVSTHNRHYKAQQISTTYQLMNIPKHYWSTSKQKLALKKWRCHLTPTNLSKDSNSGLNALQLPHQADTLGFTNLYKTLPPTKRPSKPWSIPRTTWSLAKQKQYFKIDHNYDGPGCHPYAYLWPMENHLDSITQKRYWRPQDQLALHDPPIQSGLQPITQMVFFKRIHHPKQTSPPNHR